MYLSNGHLQPLFIEVPCGRCAECLGLKREQWYLRNYWHCKECFDKGGFVLFDTLTYRDEDLPHLSMYFPEFEGKSWDYPCFSYEHYKNFMKRLRSNLSRGVFEPEYLEIQKLRKEKCSLKKSRSKYPMRKQLDKLKNLPVREWIENRIKEIDLEIDDLKDFRHWNVKDNFDAFVVCEYGSDDYYRDSNGRMRKATFRPHYHMLFYVNIPDLDCVKLAEYIANSWKHGKTDCTDECGNVRRAYTRMHNCIGKNYQRNGEIELRRVSSYVAKYITKDAWYSDKIKARVQYAGERLMKEYVEYDADLKGMYTNCYRLIPVQKNIDKLNRLVDGFHLQGNGFGLYGLDSKNFDEKELIENGTFSLPDKDHIVKHIPAPLYYVRKLYYSVVKSNSKVNSPTYVLKKEGIRWKESSLLRGYKNMCSRYTDLLLNMSEYDKLRVNFLLGDRSIDDYCKYKYFYQNRISNGSVELDLDKVIRKIVSTKPYGKGYDIYLDKDRDVYVKNGKFSLENGVYGPCYDVVRFDEFCSDNMINMWSSPEFIYFDWLDDIFDEYIKINNKKKQILFEQKEQQKAVYRMQGIKCKK